MHAATKVKGHKTAQAAAAKQQGAGGSDGNHGAGATVASKTAQDNAPRGSGTKTPSAMPRQPHSLLLLANMLLLLCLHGGSVVAATSTASGGLMVIDASSTTTNTMPQKQSSLLSAAHAASINATSMPASIAASNASTTTPATQPRKRHRKRNSNLDEHNNKLEWQNPCGGNYLPRANERPPRQSSKQIYTVLKRAANDEFHTVNNAPEGIDINNMNEWSLHNYKFKFLPKLKPNSTIALKRWYRNMQTYVASFAYLRRMQIGWDMQKLKRESRAARDLRRLLVSSRIMLCDLETAVNHTYPAPSAKQRRQLPQISRNDMNKRLKLYSKRPAAAPSAAATAAADKRKDAVVPSPPDSVDLRFVKHYYIKFLHTMVTLLRQNSKRQPKQRPKQQRKLHLAMADVNNRKEYNEVIKPVTNNNKLGNESRRGIRRQKRNEMRRVLRT